MSDMDKVLDRVKKMVTLGTNEGATEAERETALRMAYKILAKHNLSMSDLPGDSKGEDRIKDSVTISADKWARNVAQSVGQLFFCKYFFLRTGTAGKDTHIFIGLQSNTVTAMHMTDYVIKSIKREASKRFKSPTSPEGRSFCVGTMATIHKRVVEILEDKTEAEPGTALAIVGLHKTEQEANLKFLEDEGTNLVKAKARRDTSLRIDAYFDGEKFGNEVQLNKQVGQTQHNLKAIA